MNETFSCGDQSALVAYLYDECTGEERDAVAVHVTRCVSCAEDLRSLTATRGLLRAWTPPATSLGFQITDAVKDLQLSVVEGNAEEGIHSSRTPVVGSAPRIRWWARPLPAWAQAAAAVVIFASGLMIGAARNGNRAAVTAEAPAPTAASAQAPNAPNVTDVASRQDLADLEQRLRAELTRVSSANASARPRAADDAVLKHVKTMIASSEEQQRRELALRTTELVRDFDAQRRFDAAQMQRTLQQAQAQTGAEVRDQRQLVNYLLNVSQRR